MNTGGAALYIAGVSQGAQDWNGGSGCLVVSASAWPAATASLEYLGPDGVAWLPVYNSSGAQLQATFNAVFPFSLPPGKVRLTVVNATNVHARVDRVPY